MEPVSNLVDKSFPFKEYRPGQKEAIQEILGLFLSGKKHVFLDAPTGCFTDNTKISLLNGTEVAIKDLVGLLEFWVYSCTPEGKIVPGHAHSARVTKQVSELCVVTLDNQEQIKCTPEHPFMLRDGSYREAKDLKPEDSLMPLYRRIYNGKNTRLHGYEEFYYPICGDWFLTHQMVVWNLFDGYSGNQVCHHKDFNKTNNNPINLSLLNKIEHARLHSEVAKKMWKRSGYRDFMFNVNKKKWGKLETRKRMTSKNFVSVVCDICGVVCGNIGSLAKHKEMLHVENSTLYKEWLDKLKIRNSVKVICDICGKVCGNSGSLGVHKQTMHSKIEEIVCDKCSVTCHGIRGLLIHKGKFHKRSSEVLINHKVKSIEFVDETCDVYDITVDQYENFALSSGVFVHNSGKSAIAFTVHQVLSHLTPGFRTTIATRTKALQDQYVQNFPSIYDLRAKTNYRCSKSADHYDTIDCKIARKRHICDPRKFCEYVRRRNQWSLESRLRSTNHSFLFECCTAVCASPDNRCNLIILDEAHSLNDTIVEHSAVTIDIAKARELFRFYVPRYPDKILSLMRSLMDMTPALNSIFSLSKEFVKTATDLYDLVSSMYEEISEHLEKLFSNPAELDKAKFILDDADNLKEMCEILMSCEPKSDFIVFEKKDEASAGGESEHMVIKPVLARHTSKFRLFRKADIFLYMSSTLCDIPSLAKMIGAEPAANVAEVHIQNYFPVENRRIYYVPIAKVNRDNREMSLKRIYHVVDLLIEHHFKKGETRGIVHTVSYDNAKILKEMSRFKECMIIPETAQEAISSLLNGDKCVVVSPAMEEGYDLMGDMSRFQILVKIPFGYLGDSIVSYILDKYPVFYYRNAVSRIVQASGRSVRSDTDYASTYILDQNFDLLLFNHRTLFPTWYLDAVEKRKLNVTKDA